MESKDIEVSLIFDGNYRKVSLKVSPERLPESRETFAGLKDWIDSNQPTKWQQHWTRIASLMWAVLLFGFLGVTFTYAVLGSSPSPYHAQATSLLKQGISATNELKAVETILALQSGASATGLNKPVPIWWFGALGLGLLACAVASIQPNAHLAIGKGVSLVKRWRLWIKFITITVPSFVFASFVSPWLVSLIQKLFH